MEAISADKNKMSMEGLLKLEEKISRMQHGKFNQSFYNKISNIFSLKSRQTWTAV